MINNPVIDMLIRIKNAQMSKSEQVSLPLSKMKFEIANILKEEGFLNNVEKRKKKGKKATEIDYLLLEVKYNDGQGALNGVKLISKPSRKIYIKSKDIKLIRSGFGISVLSTPKGMMSSKEARKENLGGELLFEVW